MTWSRHSTEDTSLLAQSVRYVALDPRVLAQAGGTDCKPAEPSMPSSKGPLLPSTMAQSVWDAACRQWQVSEEDSVYDNMHGMMVQFADGKALPLTHLTLNLVQVRRNQIETLTSLISGQRTNVEVFKWSKSTRQHGDERDHRAVARKIARALLTTNKTFENLTTFHTDDMTMFIDYFLLATFRKQLATHLTCIRAPYASDEPGSSSTAVTADDTPDGHDRDPAHHDNDSIDDEDVDRMGKLQTIDERRAEAKEQLKRDLTDDTDNELIEDLNDETNKAMVAAREFFDWHRPVLERFLTKSMPTSVRLRHIMQHVDDTEFDVDLASTVRGSSATYRGCMSPTTEWRPLTSLMPVLRRLHLDLSGFPADTGDIDIDDEPESATHLVDAILRPVASTLSCVELWSVRPVGRALSLDILKAEHLTHLSLYNCHHLAQNVDVINTFTKLTHLDVSQSRREDGQYPHPACTLYGWTSRMPHLRHLDISNTNLADASSSGDRPCDDMAPLHGVPSDIEGLLGLHHQLDVLAVFNCDTPARATTNLPALKVAGSSTESQLILAMCLSVDKVELLCAILNEVYALYRFGASDGNDGLHRHADALHAVLTSMSRWKRHSSLQIAASASIFYVIKKISPRVDAPNDDTHMTALVKRHVIIALLNGMENINNEHVMIRNSTLVLCQFDIPNDIMFAYERTVKLLVRSLREHTSDAMSQRISIFLLNSMACMFDAAHKVACGQLGTIEVVLDRIREKHRLGECDEMMEVGWSFLWNVTDETLQNCNLLCQLGGLDLFADCYDKFNDRAECVRNMMGLIGNIAEVKSLRSRLMEKHLLRIFVTLLMNNLDDGIEIAYNSTGVIAHLCADGEANWNASVGEEVEGDEDLQWHNVQTRIVEATEDWPLTARRSFGPILRLVDLTLGSPASTHWAVWALANLTTCVESADLLVAKQNVEHADKYCSFVDKEGGRPLLEAVVCHPEVSDKLKKLATTALTNTYAWLNKDNVVSIEPMQVN